MEYFSGYFYNSVMQDFYIAMFVSNIQTLITGQLEETLNKNSLTKYTYKVNNSLSYGFMKDRIVVLFFSWNNAEKIMNELRNLFKDHLIPIRPNRSFVRVMKKYRGKTKPIVTKNQRDAF